MKDTQKVTVAYLPGDKSPVESAKRSHVKDHLTMVHPFLKEEFRSLKKTELKSKKVFKELFGEDKFESWKLNAIFEYQK